MGPLGKPKSPIRSTGAFFVVPGCSECRTGFRYWSPAFTGGLVAAGLLLAAVQALTKPIAPGATHNVEASRGIGRSLALKGTPTLAEPRAVR